MIDSEVAYNVSFNFTSFTEAYNEGPEVESSVVIEEIENNPELEIALVEEDAKKKHVFFKNGAGDVKKVLFKGYSRDRLTNTTLQEALNADLYGEPASRKNLRDSNVRGAISRVVSNERYPLFVDADERARESFDTSFIQAMTEMPRNNTASEVEHLRKFLGLSRSDVRPNMTVSELLRMIK